jgi:hypothetical protein
VVSFISSAKAISHIVASAFDISAVSLMKSVLADTTPDVRTIMRHAADKRSTIRFMLLPSIFCVFPASGEQYVTGASHPAESIL